MSIQMPQSVSACQLWVDGVGCAMLFFENELNIGHANRSRIDSSGIGIVADLAAEHASIEYRDGGYWVRPRRETVVNGNSIEQQITLPRFAQLTLGRDVQMDFRIPSVLSQSAVLSLTSGHRFESGIDQVILFEQTCLLGQGDQVHISCAGWEANVVIFERQQNLYCKATAGEMWVDGTAVGSVFQVSDGAHFQGEDWSMRFEAVSPN